MFNSYTNKKDTFHRQKQCVSKKLRFKETFHRHKQCVSKKLRFKDTFHRHKHNSSDLIWSMCL
jgi:hypothetical protein